MSRSLRGLGMVSTFQISCEQREIYYMILGMTIGEIYELAIKMGIEADPRGVKKVKSVLERTKKDYKKLSGKKKEYFDKESF